jgi:hypothetical protein
MSYYTSDVYDEESYLKSDNLDGFQLKTKASNFKSLILCAICFVVGLILIAGFLTGTYFIVNEFYFKRGSAHRNVIFVISFKSLKLRSDGFVFILLIFKLPDGHGPSSVTMAREVSGKEVLEIEKFLVGTARTSSANSWVTDSAAGIIQFIQVYQLQLLMHLVLKQSTMLLDLTEI